MRKTLSILLLSLIGCDPKEPEPRIIEIPDVHVESKIDKEPKEVKETLLDRSVLIKKYGEVLDAFVEEQLMFDEPIRNTEVGQEDGVLRGKWASASSPPLLRFVQTSLLIRLIVLVETGGTRMELNMFGKVIVLTTTPFRTL